MRRVTLTRSASTDQGTPGNIISDCGFTCLSLELPWRGNKENLSCIPIGTYPVTWRYSNVHGMCFHVENVLNRTAIEIHAGNFAGDTTLGFRSDLLGCIAPGLITGVMSGQQVVLQSRLALTALEKALNNDTFTLIIQ